MNNIVYYVQKTGSGCFNESAIIDETDWTDEIHEVVPESIKTRWNEVDKI